MNSNLNADAGLPNILLGLLETISQTYPSPNPDDTEIESCYWNLFHRDARSPDRRGLWVYISAFAGHSLETARSPKMLIHAVFHACLGMWSLTLCPIFHLTNMLIGWFNLIQKGYLHRDISIGSLVMVDDAVTTKAFGILKKEGEIAIVENITEALKDLEIDSSAKVTWEDKLTVALLGLGITDKCQGFVIGGDMATKIPNYFNKGHPGSRSVRRNLKLLA